MEKPRRRAVRRHKLRTKLLAVSCFTISLSPLAGAFTYNQPMIAYKTGVISQLNNCGVGYSKNGTYLRGYTDHFQALSHWSEDVVHFMNYKDGVVSVVKSGQVYYSPDGKNLAGGGATILVHAMPNYQAQNAPGIAVVDNHLIIPVSTTEYTIITDLETSARKITQANSEAFNYVGAVGGKIYVQFADGEIRSTDNINYLSRRYMMRLLHSSAPRLKQVIPYRFGVAALTETGIYWSTDPNTLIAGSGVTTLYSGSAKVNHILNYAGNGAGSKVTVAIDKYLQGTFINRSLSEHEGTKGLLAAFDDGRIRYSADGTNIGGGGTSVTMVSSISTEELERQLDIYLSSMNRPPIADVTMEKLSVRILNKNESSDYAKNRMVFDGDGTSAVMGVAAYLSGKPATVKLYNKGWDGFEYKWRYQGQYIGEFNHAYTSGYLAENEIRVKPMYGCAALVVLEEIANNGEPFSYTWDVNADFTLAEDRSQSLSDAFFFAEGQPEQPNWWDYNKPFDWFDWLVFAQYKMQEVIKDKYGKPIKGVDL